LPGVETRSGGTRHIKPEAADRGQPRVKTAKEALDKVPAQHAKQDKGRRTI